MKRYIFILLFLLIALPAWAINRYVDADCTNGLTTYVPATEACTGGSDVVYSTIQNALTAVAAGDTIHVRAGTYNGNITLSTSGTSGNYITLQPYTGETVYLTSSGGTDVIYGEDISYFKIIGFKIHNYYGYGIRFRGGGSHLEIRNNEIYDKINTDGTAIRVEATKVVGTLQFYTYTDIIIDGNNIHDTWSGDARYEGELLTIAFDVDRFQITNNTLSNGTHIGIDCIGYYTWGGVTVDAYPNGGIISGNTLTNIGTYAEDGNIYIDGGKNITIENNTLISNSGAGTGISISTEDSTGTTENIIVRRNKVKSFVRNTYVGATNGTTNNSRWVHNTFLMDDSSDYSNVSLLNGTGNIVKNNIFYASAGDRQMEHVYNKTYTVTFNYNDWYTGSMWFGYGGNGLGYTNFTLFQAGTGQEANGISLDPKFTDIANNNFTLSSDSPCINAGAFLTRTVGGATGTVITVQDARYFHAGYGIDGVVGDEIIVGNNSAVTVSAVDYTANTITVDESITWADDDGVSYPYYGAKPDIGWDEFIQEVPPDTFYFANNGNDNENTCESVLAPCETTAKANAKCVVAGDSCLFNRGDTWNTPIIAGANGTAENIIYFGTYGSGVRPKLDVIETLITWTPSGGGSSQLVIYPCDIDSRIEQGVPNTNFGSSTVLNVHSQSGYNYRSIVKCDFSALPAGATITNAEYKMRYYNKSGTPDGRTYGAYRVTQAGWTENGVTWNKYDGANAWISAGGDYTATNYATTVVPAVYQFMTWNITEMARDAQSGASEILHMLFKDMQESASPGSGCTYYSTETAGTFCVTGTSDSCKPSLTIDYTTGSSNLYSKTGITIKPTRMWFDTVLGTEDAAGCGVTTPDANNEWCHTGTTLYIYSSTDPTGRTIQRDYPYGVNYNGKNYITVKDIDITNYGTANVLMDGIEDYLIYSSPAVMNAIFGFGMEF